MVDGTMDGPPQTETPSRCEGVSRYARRSVPDAREDHATVSGPASQPALAALLGAARLRTYASVTGGDLARAGDLYLWATQLAGALHAQLSFVEIAVRNAIDTRLGELALLDGSLSDWTTEGATPEAVYTLLRRQLADARSRASVAAAERGTRHQRSGEGATHDDVVAQLMFGAWVKLIRPVSRTESAGRQQRLWRDTLRHAFPNAPGDDAGRIAIGKQLETLRRLRNRVAHHDNLLEVDVRHRMNGMLSVLATIDDEYPSLAASKSTLRRLAREDPRRAW